MLLQITMRTTLYVIWVLVVSSCTHVTSCPDLIEYSIEEQQAVIEERAVCPVSWKMIQDYGLIRKQIRICRD